MSKKATKQSRKTARRKAAQAMRSRTLALRARAKDRGERGVDRMSIERLVELESRSKSIRRPVAIAALPFGAAAGLLAAAASAAISRLDER